MTGGSRISADAAGMQLARLEWVDVAKGIGIILVVTGHVWTRGPVRDLIYAFHMPLFFLLSGYMSRPRPMADFAMRQLRAMVMPYIAFLLLLALWDWGFETLRGHHPIFRDGKDALWRLTMGGSELRGPFTIFWFVPSLFFGRVIQNAIAMRLPDVRDWRWVMIVASSIMLGVWLGAQTDFSPLGLLSVPVVLGLLWLGALWRTLANDRLVVLLTIPAGLLVAATLLWWNVPPLNMKVGDYGWPWLSLAAAVLLSVALCAIARIMRLRPLAWLGSASLVIMYVHVAVVHYLAPWLGKPWLLLLGIVIPVLFTLFASRFSITRRIFLGQD